MGSDTNSTTSSPNGKRSRDPEDDVYVDNLHSHKRYLSEMMASSLNGLSVGDTLPEAIMDSPVRSESMYCLRDELPLQYSPMSEDLDDARYCETPMSACSSQSDSRPTSPVSPYRYKPVGAYCYSPPGHPLPTNGSSVVTGPSSQPRQRGTETEGRLPSSPSDICHSSDLRKTALLRSVQMRTQPSCSSSYPLGLTSSQESMQTIEVETRSYSYMKPLYDVREYQGDSFSSMACKPLVNECEYHVEGPSSMVSSKPEYNTMHNNEARTEFSAMHINEAEKPSCSYMKPLDDEQGYHVERCSSMSDDSETVFTETQEPIVSIEAKPMSCSFMKPLDDGRK